MSALEVTEAAHTPCVRATKLHYHYRSSKLGRTESILHNFDLTLNSGEVLAILGPSGCGKSTLLRLVAGVVHPIEGLVRVYGKPPRDLLRGGQIALLSSESALLPWRNALQNVILPLDLLGRSRAESQNVGIELLERLRIAGKSNQRPHELSEGQRQRLRIAQALATEPELLLLDEPFSSVDEGLRHLLIRETADYVRHRQSRAAVLVTHHCHEAAVMADRILVLAGQPLKVDLTLVPSSPPLVRSQTEVADLISRLTCHLIELANGGDCSER